MLRNKEEKEDENTSATQRNDIHMDIACMYADYQMFDEASEQLQLIRRDLNKNGVLELLKKQQDVNNNARNMNTNYMSIFQQNIQQFDNILNGE
jgi:spore coat polysaccharide biosynthesis protein SpsF (cytidylyltransferase family)